MGLLERLKVLLGRGAPSSAANESRASALVRAHQAPDEAARELPGPGARARAALENLRKAAGSAQEREALESCLQLHARGEATPELSYLAAELFAKRGESAVALQLLEPLEEPRAWLFCADLLLAAGERQRAKALLERALARDIDAAQALETLSHLDGRVRPRPPVPADQVTLLNHDVSHQTLRIAGEAGRGGAATVYQALDDALGRPVALKVYHDRERFRSQLLREARTAVALAGAHVIRVFDADPESGWVAMEWAAGGALKQRLQADTGHASIERLDWFYDLVFALAAIHGAGFVHADIKPANVLFRQDNSVVLSDFGLAVRQGERHVGQSAGYVSPDRARGAPASFEDDVYALGRVLAEFADHPATPAVLKTEARPLAGRLLASSRPKHAGQLLGALPPYRKTTDFGGNPAGA